jgi:hypothetical protein
MSAAVGVLGMGAEIDCFLGDVGESDESFVRFFFRNERFGI